MANKSIPYADITRRINTVQVRKTEARLTRLDEKFQRIDIERDRERQRAFMLQGESETYPFEADKAIKLAQTLSKAPFNVSSISVDALCAIPNFDDLIRLCLDESTKEKTLEDALTWTSNIAKIMIGYVKDLVEWDIEDDNTAHSQALVQEGIDFGNGVNLKVKELKEDLPVEISLETPSGSFDILRSENGRDEYSYRIHASKTNQNMNISMLKCDATEDNRGLSYEAHFESDAGGNRELQFREANNPNYKAFKIPRKMRFGGQGRTKLHQMQKSLAMGA